MKHYPRKCSVSGKGMDEGYMFDEGMAYAKDEATARQYLTSIGDDPDEEFKALNKAFAEDGDGEYWFFWTDWHEDEGNFWKDEHFTEEGYSIAPTATEATYFAMFEDLGLDFWEWFCRDYHVFSGIGSWEHISYAKERGFEFFEPDLIRYVNKDPDGHFNNVGELFAELQKYADRAFQDHYGSVEDYQFREWVNNLPESIYPRIRHAWVVENAPKGEMTTQQIDRGVATFMRNMYKGKWK